MNRNQEKYDALTETVPERVDYYLDQPLTDLLASFPEVPIGSVCSIEIEPLEVTVAWIEHESGRRRRQSLTREIRTSPPVAERES